MILPGGRFPVFVATRPVDFRKGMDGLAALVQQQLRLDPFCGAVFVFRAKRADRVKLLVCDGRPWNPVPALVLNGGILVNGRHPASALLERLAAPVTGQPAAPPPPQRTPIHPRMFQLDGALELLVDYIVDSAVRPQPILAVGASLCALGALMGRKYRTQSVLEGTWKEPLHPGSRDLMGNCPLTKFGAKHIRTLRDRRADMPDAPNHRGKFIGHVYTWALEAEPDLDSSNPARDVGKLKVKPGGYHTWTLAEVQQYEARHPIGTKARLALAIFMFTGVRRSDAVKLGQPNVHAGQIQWTETKAENNNPKERDIPLLPQLKEIIDATPVVGTTTWLVTDFGKPFSVAGFGNKMREWCDEAELPHCSAHGLRKAGATIAAENGATAHQLMSIFGWETLKQVEKYTRKARAKRLARDAMHLIVAQNEGTSLEQKV